MVGGQIADACKQHKEARAAAAAAAEAATAEAKGEAKEAAVAGAGAAAAPASTTAAASDDELKFAAVVDPPRSGVHAKCLRSIRSTEEIKRLVREERGEKEGGGRSHLVSMPDTVHGRSLSLVLLRACRRGFLEISSNFRKDF